MESCLLCLDINKDILDCIKADSVRWQENDIANTIEKHFWPLNTIKSSSWICLLCWRELDDFHKFYLRVEEAHKDFGKIKIEENELPVQCKNELPIPKTKTKGNEEIKNIDNMAYCFLEPEILIDQPLTPEFVADKETETTKLFDDIDLDDIPLKQACKRFKLQKNVVNNDPLEKLDKSDVKSRTRKSKATAAVNKVKTEESKSIELQIKQEPEDLNSDSESVSDNDNEDSDVNFQPNKNRSAETAKSRTQNTLTKKQQKENDQFISEHFKQMYCDLCQEPFKDFPAMKKHFLQAHQQAGYVVCCKRKYFNRRLLVDHIHCHLNPDHFKCNDCGKIMCDRLRLKNHIMWVHKSKEVVKKHCCDVCGKSFIDAHHLRMHKLIHLKEEEKKFPCQECGKFYASSYILNRHVQAVHLKKFFKICYICGKSISSSTDYKIHLNKHEGLPQPIISCDICGLRLTTERGLKRHKDTQHPIDGKKEHHCPKCPKISPTLKALRKHISTMHEERFNYKCSVCGKAFKRAEVLREHMASHTGTPLYTCPWCPKTFNSNGNMHAHRKKEHPIEWEEAKLQKYSGNFKSINAIT